MTKHPDIAERLRDGEPCHGSARCRVMDARSGCCCAAGADEIERLRAALSTAHDWLKVIDTEMLSFGSQTLKPALAQIEASLHHEQSAPLRKD